MKKMNSKFVYLVYKFVQEYPNEWSATRQVVEVFRDANNVSVYLDKNQRSIIHNLYGEVKLYDVEVWYFSDQKKPLLIRILGLKVVFVLRRVFCQNAPQSLIIPHSQVFVKCFCKKIKKIFFPKFQFFY